MDKQVEAASKMTVTFDVVDVGSALLEPLILLVFFFLIKNLLPAIFASLPRVFERFQRVSLGYFSLELAAVQSISP